MRTKNKDKPLFIYLALAAPHTPLVPSKKFEGKSGVGAYGDFVMEIDDLVGKVDAHCKKKGMEKNTILIFSSDNGALLHQRRQRETRSQCQRRAQRRKGSSLRGRASRSLPAEMA